MFFNSAQRDLSKNATRNGGHRTRFSKFLNYPTNYYFSVMFFEIFTHPPPKKMAALRRNSSQASDFFLAFLAAFFQRTIFEHRANSINAKVFCHLFAYSTYVSCCSSELQKKSRVQFFHRLISKGQNIL